MPFPPGLLALSREVLAKYRKTNVAIYPSPGGPVSPTTSAVAAFASGMNPEDVSVDLQHAVKRLILESLAVTILGGKLPLGKEIAGTLGAGSAPYQLPQQMDAWSVGRAAFINTAWADCNDSAGGSYKSVVHPGKNVLPVVLTVGLAEGLSGNEVLLAALVGTEISFRLDFAIGLDHTARGHYSDGTIGCIGATIALARLLGLDADRIEAAIGNAVLLLPATLGGETMWTAAARPLALGQGANSAVCATSMARAGIDGPANALETEGGFAYGMGGTTDLSRVTQDLGEVWETSSYYLKPYVGCKLTHPEREGILALKKEVGFAPGDVERIVLRHPGFDLPIVSHHAVFGANAVEASCSSPYLLANALLYEDLGPDVLTAERTKDRAIHELAARVHVVEDRELTKGYAGGIEARGETGTPVQMEVHLRSGDVHTFFGRHAKGDPLAGWEFTDDELDAKFRSYTEGVLDKDQADAVIEEVRSLENVQSLANLRQHLGG